MTSGRIPLNNDAVWSLKKKKSCHYKINWIGVSETRHAKKLTRGTVNVPITLDEEAGNAERWWASSVCFQHLQTGAVDCWSLVGDPPSPAAAAAGFFGGTLQSRPGLGWLGWLSGWPGWAELSWAKRLLLAAAAAGAGRTKATFAPLTQKVLFSTVVPAVLQHV